MASHGVLTRQGSSPEPTSVGDKTFKVLSLIQFLNRLTELFPLWVITGSVLALVHPTLFTWFQGPLITMGLGIITPFAVGLILVACCPGGTASNVITFLAHAKVALSVTLTAVSTIMAVIMTPALTTYLVGNLVEVDSWQPTRSHPQRHVEPNSLYHGELTRLYLETNLIYQRDDE